MSLVTLNVRYPTAVNSSGDVRLQMAISASTWGDRRPMVVAQARPHTASVRDCGRGRRVFPVHVSRESFPRPHAALRSRGTDERLALSPLPGRRPSS